MICLKKKIIFFACLLCFVCVSLSVYYNKTDGFDLFVYNFIISFKCQSLTDFFKVVTLFGGEYVIIFITFSFLIIKDKKYFWFLFFDMIIIVLSNYFLKMFFLRERPFNLMIIDETGYSYPSGHSMVAAGFYGFILYLVWKMKINKIYKYFSSFALIFSFISGFSLLFAGFFSSFEITILLFILLLHFL